VEIVLRLGQPQYDNRRLFGMLAFKNGLEYRSFNFSALIGNHFCTLCRNFVRFNLVTPEFKMIEVVQLASIILSRLVQLRLLDGGAVRHYGDQTLGVFHQYLLEG